MNITIFNHKPDVLSSAQKVRREMQAASMVPATVTAVAPVAGGTYEQLASL